MVSSLRDDVEIIKIFSLGEREMLVAINKLTKNFGFGNVFEDISFSVEKGDRLALVGKNGCGKSTILKCIMDKESFAGSVTFGKGVRIGYLEQTAPDGIDNRVVIDILKEPFKAMYARQLELEKLAERMCNVGERELEKLVEKYSMLQEKFIEDGGYDIDNTINYVVNGLKIDNKLLNREYNTLSGGEKTLVHFARILLDNPDLLLLDEPTNHLDIERIEWLEGYLKRFKGGVVLVSHDRYFLDKIITTIIDVEDNGCRYVGNYTQFVKAKEDKELKEFEQYKNEQKKIEELKKAVARLRVWGENSDNPSIFRRAKAIQKRIDELTERAITKPKNRRALPIKFGDSTRSGSNVILINKFSLMRGDKILFENQKLDIRVFDKVAIVGINGIGKSSLIKCIMGEIEDYEGVITVGNSVRIGYLPQMLVFENDSETLLDYVNRITGFNNEESRRILARFEFYKTDVEKSIGSLSGGEKIRLRIACLLTKDVNTLIFDEPTNHIDIFTREILEDALKTFKGTILFVSHDRYFINSIANKVLEIKDGQMSLFDGDYDMYKRKDEIVQEEVVYKQVKIKPPNIRKGGKW